MLESAAGIGATGGPLDPIPYIEKVTVSVRFASGGSERWVIKGEEIKGIIKQQVDETNPFGTKISFVLDGSMMTLAKET